MNEFGPYIVVMLFHRRRTPFPIKPFGSLEAAAMEAGRRNRWILAFVYDPTQLDHGKLRWALDCFL